jgi:hypothetical protein
MPKGKNRKNTTYKVLHQKCHTQNAVKKYQEKRTTEKKLHNKKRSGHKRK